MAAIANEKKVFVTVGTTSFDELTEAICASSTCKALAKLGYCEVVLQIGRGVFEPGCDEIEGVKLVYYRYKDSLTSDIVSADLVISHAGAGTCLEVLDAQRPLLVVINDKLMGNHQLELAQKLHEDSHILYTTCRELVSELENMNLSLLQPLEPGKPEKFASYLDKVMGIS